MQLDLAISTNNMLSRDLRRYDVVITDMKRGDNAAAGYEVIDAMAARSPGVPVIVYSASSSPAFQQEAMARGAYAETNSPAELVRLIRVVLDARDSGSRAEAK